MSQPRTGPQREAARKWNRRRNLELLRMEKDFRESGKWKTEGCWCGAGPARIEHVNAYTELSYSHLYLVHVYRCADCKRQYETKREVT
ncbi:MAG: hypothetical protein IH577_04560 [Deltaproteobacteria bacterium]|nr:hypothetical protein [Deltaproteobacteria bacterium]